MTNTREESISIEGMSCNHCIRAVEQALESVEGLNRVHVEIGRADISYDSRPETRDRAVRAIEEAGFGVQGGGRE